MCGMTTANASIDCSQFPSWTSRSASSPCLPQRHTGLSLAQHSATLSFCPEPPQMPESGPPAAVQSHAASGTTSNASPHSLSRSAVNALRALAAIDFSYSAVTLRRITSPAPVLSPYGNCVQPRPYMTTGTVSDSISSSVRRSCQPLGLLSSGLSQSSPPPPITSASCSFHASMSWRSSPWMSNHVTSWPSSARRMPSWIARSP
mmetsp:Transcript_49318/g.163331  ORF Transcript_49318/g.163331 Transcript_49318/m.163331 type:complete len:204 (-) Transcript_49318:149-760(-)